MHTICPHVCQFWCQSWHECCYGYRETKCTYERWERRRVWRSTVKKRWSRTLSLVRGEVSNLNCNDNPATISTKSTTYSQHPQHPHPTTPTTYTLSATSTTYVRAVAKWLTIDVLLMFVLCLLCFRCELITITRSKPYRSRAKVRKLKAMKL